MTAYETDQIPRDISLEINYIELPARDLDATRTFYERVFGWHFRNHGEDYISFSNSGVNGGFFRSPLHSSTQNGAALVVLYSHNLEGTLGHVVDAGGKIVSGIFDFPGGSRFHFSDPNGNELAVWSDR